MQNCHGWPFVLLIQDWLIHVETNWCYHITFCTWTTTPSNLHWCQRMLPKCQVVELCDLHLYKELLLHNTGTSSDGYYCSHFDISMITNLSISSYYFITFYVSAWTFLQIQYLLKIHKTAIHYELSTLITYKICSKSAIPFAFPLVEPQLRNM